MSKLINIVLNPCHGCDKGNPKFVCTEKYKCNNWQDFYYADGSYIENKDYILVKDDIDGLVGKIHKSELRNQL